MAETPNHGYNVPEEGTENWHEDLNANFEAFEADIEIRDAGAPGANGYDPMDGAKYLDTTTGDVYLANESSWSQEFSFGDGGGGGGGIESLSGGEGIDPDSIGDGDTVSVAWADANSLGSNGGITDFSGASDLTSDGRVDTLSGALTGDQSLTDIAGTNLSISNGQLNAAGGSGGGISGLTGGDGITPGDIGDGDTVSVAWGDGANLGTDGQINDFSEANDLDADGNVTGGGGGGISSLTGGEGIDPGSIGDGDTLSVAWGDAAGLDSTGTPDEFSNAGDLDSGGSVDTLSGGVAPSGKTVENIAGGNLTVDDQGNLNASTSSGGGISGLGGGDGIDPTDIGDGDTLSVAWGDANDLDADGNVTGGGGGIGSLTGGDGINPADIGDGDTVSAAWGDASVLDANGAIADWSGAADLDASGAITASVIGSLSGGDGINPGTVGDGDTLSVAWGDAADLASDGSVDQLSGSLTGGQALTDIAGTNLSIDSNGQLNAAGGSGGISGLTGGDGIDPSDIGDGDTLSVAWGDAANLGSGGLITDFSEANDLDADGNVTASTNLSGGDGISPDSIGDGDSLSVASGDISGPFLSTDGSNNLTVNAGSGLEDDGSGTLQASLGNALGFDGSSQISVTSDTVTVAGNAVSLGGSTAIGHADLSGVSENQHHSKNHDHTETGISAVPNAGLANSSVTVSPGNGLQSGGQVSLGGSTTLDVNPADVAGTGLTGDGNSNLEVAWEDANDLDADGNVTSATSLSGGDGINPDSITDGDTLSVAPSDIAGSFLSTDGSNNLTVDAGSGLENDGSDNLQAALGNALGFDGSSQIAVTTDTVTVAGNAVSLGGSTGIAHTDLTGVNADQHHSKDHDHTEAGVSAVPNAGLANSSVTVSPGNGLQSGGQASLGGSTTLDVNPAGVAGTGLADDGNSNLEVAWEDAANLGSTGQINDFSEANDLDASGSVTTSTNLSGGNGISPASITDGDTLSVAPGDIAGTALEADGTDLAVSSGGIGSTELASGAVTSTEISDGTIGTVDIGQNSASDGHVFRWNGTSWVTGFPGTLDSSTPFELLAGGTSTLRLDPNGLDEPNVVTGTNQTVNSGTGLTVGGGSGHTIGGNHPTVAGGESNEASTDYATVAGGINNEASANTAAVGGGSLNKATGQQATVAGGNDNTAGATHATVAGGQSNEATGLRAAVSGGRNNLASGEHTTVGGGERNTAQAQYATIGGGGPSEPDNNPGTTKNIVYDNYGTIGGGGNNQAGSDDGDSQDPANAEYPTVGGGRKNTASGQYSTVGGGWDNTASGLESTVGGGMSNTASGIQSTVGGGDSNTASGEHATVPGGEGNIASGNQSFAAGQWAEADADWSFVWVDGSGEESSFGGPDDRFKATTSDGSGVSGSATFNVKATDGVRFITATDNSAVTYISDGGTGWNTASSRAVKTNVDPVNPEQALAGVDSMEVATWEYGGEAAGTTHIGPMAEEFHDAFDVGDSDEHINSVNADGVAFAAIQGLSAELDDVREELAEREEIADTREELAEREERIADLEAENERLQDTNERLQDANEQLRERNAELEDRLAAIEDHLGLGDSGATTQGVADD